MEQAMECYKSGDVRIEVFGLIESILQLNKTLLMHKDFRVIFNKEFQVAPIFENLGCFYELSQLKHQESSVGPKNSENLDSCINNTLMILRNLTIEP